MVDSFFFVYFFMKFKGFFFNQRILMIAIPSALVNYFLIVLCLVKGVE